MGSKWTLPMMAAAEGQRDALRTISEYDFQVAVCRYAESSYWRVWYTRRSGMKGTDGQWRGSGPRGEPDLRMVNRLQRRAVWLELKAERGTLTDDQRVSLEWLQAAGCEAAVCKPRDARWLMRLLDGEVRIEEGRAE